MTSVGIPTWLAGEEFGDVHDTEYTDVNAKQQDPVQWNRALLPGNTALKANVAKLVQLRMSHPALQRNEVEFFYYHPHFDDNDAPRVFDVLPKWRATSRVRRAGYCGQHGTATVSDLQHSRMALEWLAHRDRLSRCRTSL